MSRLFFSRRAERQLRRLPGEVRVHVETHLENLALMMRSSLPLSQLLSRLEREEDGFITTVEGRRVSFALDTVLRVLLVHNIEVAAAEHRAPGGPGLHGALTAT